VKELLNERFASLAAEGQRLIARLPRDQHGLAYWVSSTEIPTYQAWLSAVTNLVGTIAPSGSVYPSQLAKITAHENMASGVPVTVVQQVHGVFTAAHADWETGLLRRIEYIYAASTFDDFLDHAARYHKSGKKTESAVLASAVLEDTIKKLASKHSITTASQSLEQLIDALVAADVLTPTKSKRVKSWSAVRNHAFHAEWDQFDIKDVGTMIEGIREILANHL
jgi:hypothetical protein